MSYSSFKLCQKTRRFTGKEPDEVLNGITSYLNKLKKDNVK